MQVELRSSSASGAGDSSVSFLDFVPFWSSVDIIIFLDNKSTRYFHPLKFETEKQKKKH